MFGENAKAVKIDLTGIEKREYSFEIVDEWSTAMKAALRKDFESLECIDEQRTIIVDCHYKMACEVVIGDLLFELKWAKIALKRLEDENKG